MSDKKRFNYVFCDLDGTLLEDKQRHYECYKAIVKKYGGNCIPLDEYWNDKRNKVKRTVLLEKTGFQGQCLHARKIGFIHPSTGEYMEFTSDLPDYFEKFLTKLRRITNETF